MNIKALYENLCEFMPEYLREDWDNDGLMCCADGTVECKKVLVALDVTEEVVDYAINSGFNLIISHHPLIFKPLGSLNEENHIARKVIKLISNNVSVFSFHTRADKALGGVNDRLAKMVGIVDPVPFGEGGLGRIGDLSRECDLDMFIGRVKKALKAEGVRISDGYTMVKRVAVVGGDGKDFVKEAILAGADTYVSGRIGYNLMEEAAEMGINLIEAGHYYTEFPITSHFKELISRLDKDCYVEIVDSNLIKVV